MNTIYQSAIQALRKPGIDTEKPTVLLTATTGKAASNIDGITLHSAFNLPVKERGKRFEFRQPDVERLNNMRCLYTNLKIIVTVIDEISMLKNQDLVHLNLILQTIYENNLAFGGISILGVGDLLQLNPVGGSPVFQSSKGSYCSLAGYLWENCFKLYEFKKNDPRFAQILSRLRTNECTEEDLSFLEELEENTCVSEGAIHLFMTNKQANEHNQKMLKMLDSEIVSIEALDSTKDLNTQTIAINLDKQNIHNTGGLAFKVDLAEGARWTLTKNIDLQDGLVNGASGTIRKIDIDDTKMLGGKIYIQFDNPKLGKKRRKKHETATPIEAVTARFNLNERAAVSVEHKQYPGMLAWGLTTHKAQGSTYSEMAADMTRPSNVKVIPQELVYTMLSRGKTSKQVKIINFNPSFIKVNKGAMDEMNRMKLHASLKWCNPIKTLKEMNVVILAIYRCPRGNIQMLFKEIEKIVFQLKKQTEKIIICGDFNLDLYNLEKLTAFLQRYCITQYISEPTHLNGGILDLLYATSNLS